MSAAFITHPECLKHEMGAHHPEQPARLSAIEDQLIASGVAPYITRYEAPLATDEQLARVHPIEYVRAIRELAPKQGTVHLDPDTAMNPWSLQAALRAAGAAVLAVDLTLSNKAKTAFCAVRPPGHHAESRRAMGFCALAHGCVGHLRERVRRRGRVRRLWTRRAGRRRAPRPRGRCAALCLHWRHCRRDRIPPWFLDGRSQTPRLAGRLCRFAIGVRRLAGTVTGDAGHSS